MALYKIKNMTKKSSSIENIFPIILVDDDIIFSKSGDAGLCFKFTLPPIYSLSKTDVLSINSTFDKFLRTLPEKTIIQKQDFFYINKLTDSVSKPSNILTKSDNLFFYEQETMSHECYVTITKTDISKKAISVCNKLEQKKYFEDLDVFINKCLQCVSFLDKTGFFTLERLKTEEILDLFSKYFSLEKIALNVIRDISFEKGLKIGSKLVEAYTIHSNDQLPISIPPTKKHIEFSTQETSFEVPFIQPLSLGLDTNHVLNQVIYIDNSNAILKKLKTKLNQFNSLSMVSKENALIYNNIDETLGNVIEKELKFVKLHLSCFVWGETDSELKKSRNKLENIFREMGIVSHQEKFGLKSIFINNCPGAASKLPESSKFISVTEQSSLFVNFESIENKAANGILLCERKTGTPLKVDLWDEPVKKGLIVNRNRLIFGPSGTGKSFLINHIASQYYEQGHHVIMLDIGNSYKKLCTLVNGSYFTYEVDNPLEFNPFFLYDDGGYNIEKKTFLVSLLIFLWKGEREYSKEEKTILTKYLDSFYQNIGNIIPSFKTFFEFVRDNEISKKEELYFDKTSFTLSTQDFYDGQYEAVLNSNNPINLIDQRFIVFEMDNIKDDPILFPLVTMLSIEVIMKKIQKLPEVKKSIFIDECWKPISKGEMAEFIKYLYKTVRKYYGEIAIATQDLEDILETVAGPAMINNTDTLILLSHKKKMSSKDKFSKYLSFTESDLVKLFSTDKREVFIKVGSSSRVYKVKVSPERYACYSSNADENNAILKTYKKHDNMELAINEFVSQK